VSSLLLVVSGYSARESNRPTVRRTRKNGGTNEEDPYISESKLPSTLAETENNDEDGSSSYEDESSSDEDSSSTEARETSTDDSTKTNYKLRVL